MGKKQNGPVLSCAAAVENHVLDGQRDYYVRDIGLGGGTGGRVDMVVLSWPRVLPVLLIKKADPKCRVARRSIVAALLF